MYRMKIYVILTAWVLTFTLSARVGFAATKVSETEDSLPLTVQWQMIRSRSQAMLAGTLTETYAARWTLNGTGSKSFIHSSTGRANVSWSPDINDIRTGTIMMTRGDLVELLGIEQELPQDGRVWQTDEPLIIFIQGASGRVSVPVFRHVDDNGTVVIRLSARLASSP